MSGALISAITRDSPADSRGLLVGDELVSINGREPTDIIEYQQLIDGERVDMLVQRANEPLRRRFVITKDAGQPLGLAIDSAVFDRIRTCDNHCTFCFIYQLPKGLRRSLYVKDDDFRLSFLYGNYTTLTRFTEFDLERVISEALSPLYVSIHTTNPALRAAMLRNPRGATSLRWLDELLRADIEVHGQVVVCPGINDSHELERTIEDVLTQYRQLASLSLVPLGISDFSSEVEMRSHTIDEAKQVVELVEHYQSIALELLGRPLVFASDEFYLQAELPTPQSTSYVTVDLVENGVGLVALFSESFRTQVDMTKLGSGFFQSVDGAPALGYRAPRVSLVSDMATNIRPTILTGEYAAPILRNLLDEAHFDHVDIIEVHNRYFGGNIKVAGLMTGSDIQRTIDESGLDRTYLIPDVCLSEDVFLDGMTLKELTGNVHVVETTGTALRNTLKHSVNLTATQS